MKVNLPVKDDTVVRPNIVLVLTDDQGPWAVPWEMPELQMPALAELADTGFRFDQFYCASPVCSPARASLLTGKMPSAHGVHDWLIGLRHPEAKPDHYLEDMLTLPQVLAGAGYRCGMSGKWHVGEANPPAPGFEYWYAHRFGGGPYYDAPIWDENGEPATEPKYLTEAIADHAEEFLDQQDADTPFFLYAATTAPHTPWGAEHHPERLLELYADEEFASVPREEPHPWAAPRYEDFKDAIADPQAALRGYCAALTGVDELIARLRDKLEEKQLADNTIFIFMADNGFSCGHHGIWGKGNGTLPLNFWDNSVRVPAVIYFPPQLRERFGLGRANRDSGGVVVTHPVSAVDIMPTLCELAAADLPVDPVRAGQSIMPLLEALGNRDPREAGAADDYPVHGLGQENPGNAGDERRAAVENELAEQLLHPVVVFDEYGGGRMLRTRTWKLVVRHADGPCELYNMMEDPHERDNLAENHADDEFVQWLLGRLGQHLEEWFTQHETALYRAFAQPVRGYGQIHPVWRADRAGTCAYELGNVNRDGQ